MIKYLQKIKKLSSNLRILKIQWIPEFYNARADALPYLAISNGSKLPKGVFIEYLKTSGIKETPIVSQVEMNQAGLIHLSDSLIKETQ